MNVVLLGSPASGKGTQADLLCKKFNLYHLSTGEVARKLAEKDQRIREIIDSGKLIPAEEMTMHVINFLSNEKSDLKNILFEGFPRFISQFEALSNFLITKGDNLDLVISLEVSQGEAIKRISSRRVCEVCGENFNLITKPPEFSGKCDKCGSNLIQRKDDNEDSVKVRFEYYENNTKELIDYVERIGKLTKVNGERPIDEIQKDLIEIVERVKDGQNYN
jgi:adenylate kinase